jgi:hypothetical protein
VGYFYQLPPVYTGGTQPYAPPPGLVQSGPLPTPPPPNTPAPLNTILSIWYPPGRAPKYMGDFTPVPPLPSTNYQMQSIVSAWWQLDPPIIIDLPSAAGNVGLVSSNAPTVSPATLMSIIRTWDPPQYVYLQPQENLAPVLIPPNPPDNPPRFSWALTYSIILTWTPPPYYPPNLPASPPKSQSGPSGAVLFVPPLIGLQIAVAQAELQSLGFLTVPPISAPSLTPPGTVIAQSIPAGAAVPAVPQPSVTLTVSQYLLVVPNVVGLYVYDAQQAILGGGFMIAPPILQGVSEGVTLGIVLSQSIAAGTTFPAAQQVTISITVAAYLTQLPPQTP